MRVFIAIEFDDEIKRYLKSVQEVVKLGISKGNYTRYNNFHLTLRYIGEVDNGGVDNLCDLIDKVASQSKPFDIKLGDLGQFKSKHKSIVWQGIVGGKKELNNIYNLIENNLEEYGFKKENRKYKPHITLVRQATFNESSVLESIPIFQNSIRIKKISLMLSDRIDDVLQYTALYRREL